MEIDRKPQAKSWAIPLMLGSSALIWSMLTLNPNHWTYMIFGVGCICLIWAIINGWEHVGHIHNSLKAEARDADYRYTETYRAEVIAKMNEGQLKAWNRGGRVEIDYEPGLHGPVEYIRGTRSFLNTAWWMLINSKDGKLYPIRNFKQGTFHFDTAQYHELDDYDQAKEITAYMVWRGWVTWHLGNDSARFVGEHTPDTVLGYFGLTRKSYEPEVPELSE